MQIIRVKQTNSSENTGGCEKAPIEILKELKSIETNEKGVAIEYQKHNLEEIHVNSGDIGEGNHLIYHNSIEVFEKNDRAFFIGGDHNISYPITKAFSKVEKDPLIIVFDAHADCLAPGEMPSNREWLRALIEQTHSKVILVGARNISEEENRFLRNNSITRIKMDVLQEELQEVCDVIMEQARQSTGFYISIDVDVLDPAFAPGTSCLEPGGLSSRDLIYMIKRLSLLDNFRGADVVEINLDEDSRNLTVKLGAKLLAEML